GLVSEDGFAIASEGEVSVDDDAVAAGAVRMMIQVRAMSKALGQSGASQMFLEGSDSGICVIDKDPWVLVVVGAPGVPIGLLRYEAREIAEAFPMGQRPALTASPESTEDDEPESASQADWAVVNTGTFLADEFVEEQSADLSAADDFVTDPDGTPEIRWADEPTIPEAGFGDDFLTADPAAAFATPDIAVEEQPAPNDFSDWTSPGMADVSGDSMFDLPPPAPDVPVSFEMPEPVDDAVVSALDDLSDLAAPTGDPIDLPPPMGPAFELPPPE
ncbi:MAG: roadblock/LC7 domain-containing protein, partial [Candidatus Nanopelagicales bacterium]|nr:roadblock/LC7 domain-containing protein [Candidatus Nanopelagicales bacterium]